MIEHVANICKRPWVQSPVLEKKQQKIPGIRDWKKKEHRIKQQTSFCLPLFPRSPEVLSCVPGVGWALGGYLVRLLLVNRHWVCALTGSCFFPSVLNSVLVKSLAWVHQLTLNQGYLGSWQNIKDTDSSGPVSSSWQLVQERGWRALDLDRSIEDFPTSCPYNSQHKKACAPGIPENTGQSSELDPTRGWSRFFKPLIWHLGQALVLVSLLSTVPVPVWNKNAPIQNCFEKEDKEGWLSCYLGLFQAAYWWLPKSLPTRSRLEYG